MSTKEVELTESTPVSDPGEEGPRWSVQGKFQTFSDTPQAHPEEWGPISGYF